MATSPRFGLTLLDEGQAGGEVVFNEAVLRLEGGLGGVMRITTFQVNTPATGVNGEWHVVGSSPTGAWAGQANKLAGYENGGWIFVTPKKAQWIWREDGTSNHLRLYDGSVWQGGTSVPDITTVASVVYVQAEAQAAIDKIKALQDALQALGIIET